MAAWKCTVCGYIYQGENPPDICPVCKAPASKFVKLDGPKTENSKNGFFNRLKNLFKK